MALSSWADKAPDKAALAARLGIIAGRHRLTSLGLSTAVDAVVQSRGLLPSGSPLRKIAGAALLATMEAIPPPANDDERTLFQDLSFKDTWTEFT
ncbi:MAG: hypothetical protein ACKVPX_02025 [Myxococcaceae bacterium]